MRNIVTTDTEKQLSFVEYCNRANIHLPTRITQNKILLQRLTDIFLYKISYLWIKDNSKSIIYDIIEKL